MNMKELGISQTWCEFCIWWYLVRSQASLWWYCFVVILNVWMNGEFRFGLEGNCGSWGKSQQRRCAELSMSVASACESVCRECFVDVFRHCTVCVCVTGIYMERDASCCHNKLLVLKTSQTALRWSPRSLWLLPHQADPAVGTWQCCIFDSIPTSCSRFEWDSWIHFLSLPFTSFVNPMGDFDMTRLMTWPSWHILTKCISDLTFIIYVSGLIDHSLWRLRVQEETVGQLLWPTTVCYLPLLVLRARLHIFSLFLYMSDIMWLWDWVGLFCFVV